MAVFFALPQYRSASFNDEQLINTVSSTPFITGAAAVDGAYKGSLAGLGIAAARNGLKSRKWTDEEKVVLATGTPEEKQALRQKMQEEGRRVSYKKAAGIGAATGAVAQGTLGNVMARQTRNYYENL